MAFRTVAYFESQNWTYEQISSYMYSDEYKKRFLAYAKASSQSASRKAVKRISGDCSIIGFINPTTSRTYFDAKQFLKANFNSGLGEPNYTITGISLPTSYKYLQSIGEDHNGIILSTITGNNPSRIIIYQCPHNYLCPHNII